MKLSILTWVAAVTALLAVSCSQEDEERCGTGYLYMTAETDFSVVPVLKSVETEQPVMVAVTDASGDLVSRFEWSESLAPIELLTGSYSAVATAGTACPAAFDAPLYSATEDFSIRYGEVCNLNLVLALDNVKVTASFSDNVKENFSSYVLTVSNGLEDGTLVYDMDAEGGSTLDKEGYFAATGTLSWSLKLVNNSGEVFETLSGEYDGVRPREHYALKFDVQPEDEFGGSEFKVILNDELNEKVFDLVLDFVNKDVPKMQTDIDLSSKSAYYTGDASAKQFTITTPNQKDFTSLSLASDAFTVAGLEQSIELVGASEDFVTLLSQAGISVPAIVSGKYTEELDLTGFVAKLPAGSYSIEIFAQNVTGASKLWTWTFEVKSSVETLSANPWAKFAVLEGRWMSPEKPAGLTFAYRAAADSEWSYVDAASLVYDESAKTFSAEVTSLNSATEYVFKAVTDYEAATKEISFTTETELTIPNLDFDDWYLDSDGKTWYPDVSSSEFYWDTANGGSKTAGKYPTNPEEENVYISGEGKKAARLMSEEVKILSLDMLAAGNIYTGRFIKAIISMSNPGAELDWGVPFTSRPVALKGYYHYLPEPINKDKLGMSGQTDTGQIQIMLTDWSTPFRVNTQTKTFVDINADYIIGYGSLDLSETSGYTEFEIKLDYRDKTRKPTYIVIVGAASKYGDYFTGGVGSTLYLDEFELVY